jgi:hypothetical protein
VFGPGASFSAQEILWASAWTPIEVELSMLKWPRWMFEIWKNMRWVLVACMHLWSISSVWGTIGGKKGHFWVGQWLGHERHPMSGNENGKVLYCTIEICCIFSVFSSTMNNLVLDSSPASKSGQIMRKTTQETHLPWIGWFRTDP